MKSAESEESVPPIEFPVAAVRESGGAKRIFASKLWWVTLACAVIAGVLAWQAIPATGPTITIDFPQGHGLKPGDALRHRGIEVGVVTSASLNRELSDIKVTVELKPDAEVLCRKGSRFWIVRPRIDLTGIQGLETAVGSKYVAVSPGLADAVKQSRFTGLPAAPPDELTGEGLELVLRADHRSGLNPGAPVTWRGVEVGKVLSVGLSPDARHVDAGIRLNRRYRKLVTESSKFWVTSGIDVHVGLDGFDINVESLTSLALGGISFLTIAGADSSESVRNGHVFTLHSTVDESWLDNSTSIALIDVELPTTVIVEGSVRTSFLGIPRTASFAVSGLLVKSAGGVTLLTGRLPATDAEHGLNIPELRVRQPGTDEVVTIAAFAVSDESGKSPNVVMIPFPGDAGHGNVHQPDRLRHPAGPEECCVTRTVFRDGDVTSVVHTIGRQSLRARDDVWQLHDDDPTDLTSWNGAPVVSFGDGRVIGILTTTDRGTVVIPIPVDLGV